MRFSETVAIVTGGNFGIGRAIAHRLASEGAAVAIAARNQKRANAVVEEILELGAECAFFKTDVSDEASITSLIDNVANQFGKINYVVNNAGVGSQHCGIEAEDPPGKRWKKFREVNLDSTYLVTAHALPHLVKNADSAIVNISSTATFHGNWGLYGVAKTGVDGMTRSFAAEAAPYGIRVNAISPGWIETSPEETAAAAGNEGGDWDMPPSLLNRMGTPEEIASTAAFLLSTESSFITGQTLVVDGGLMILDYPSRPSLETVGHRVYSHSGNLRNDSEA
ncbi:MAG: SDR family oxidoreductase [Gammaproteobacteria bacterium]|nr:SDR family oxidoreductase [Gammaproteobacteria bacterium]